MNINASVELCSAPPPHPDKVTDFALCFYGTLLSHLSHFDVRVRAVHVNTSRIRSMIYLCLYLHCLKYLVCTGTFLALPLGALLVECG